MASLPITYITIEPNENGDKFDIAVRPHGSNIIIAQDRTDGTPSDIAKAESRLFKGLERAGIKETKSSELIEKISGIKAAQRQNIASSVSIPFVFADVTATNNNQIAVSIRQRDSNETIEKATIGAAADENQIHDAIKTLSKSERVKMLTDNFPVAKIIENVQNLQSELKAATPAETVDGGVLAIGALQAQHEKGRI